MNNPGMKFEAADVEEKIGDASSIGSDEAHIVRARDGYNMRYAHYPAQGTRKAIVLWLHGVQSHAGWYTHSCQRMANAGLEIYFVDRRGSGMNRELAGHCNNYRQLRNDVIDVLEKIRAENPGVPIILAAISWGGKLAVLALKKRPELADGLILLCPGFFAKVHPTAKEKFQVGLFGLFRPKRLMRVPLSDPALFTNTPKWQEFIANDDRALTISTARLLLSSFLMDFVVRGAPKKIHHPALLLVAGQDRIIHNDRTKKYFQTFASNNKTVLEYPDAHHTLEFEPDPDPIIDDTIAWITKTAHAVAQKNANGPTPADS